MTSLPESFREKEKRVDYDAVRSFKIPYLKEAFERFREQKLDQEADYRQFADQEWVKEYSVFRALKAANGGTCWNEWKKRTKTGRKPGGSLRRKKERKLLSTFFFSISSSDSG